MNDAELLAQFVRDHSQPAFAELVRRHVDWVYSAALRRVRDAHLAEDVTQATFIVLATRASSLGRQRVLSAWLFHVVAHVSAQALRREARRKRHETIAAQQMQMTINPNSEGAVNREWEQVAHLLDGAVGRLRDADREAVMLRFFEQKSFAEVGVALGITEEAARKRVFRATEKLRDILHAKGAAMPSAMLGAVLLAEVTKPAPAAVLAMASSGTTTGAAMAGATVSLAKGAMAIMAWTKIKFAAAVVLISVLLVGGGVVIALQMKAADPAPNSPAVANPAPVENNWRVFFDAVYNLEEGQIVKRIAPPFIPERKTYYQVAHATQARSIASAPDYFTFHWENSQLKNWGYGFTNKGNTLSGVLLNSFEFELYEFEGPDELLKSNVTGDWILRPEVPAEQMMAKLAPIFSEAIGRKLKIEKATVLRDVWVASGQYAYQPDPAAAGKERGANRLALYVDEFKAQDGGGGGNGDLAKFFRRLGSQIGLRIVDETTGPRPETLNWTTQDSSYVMRSRGRSERDQNTQKLLDVVTAQTGLKFSKEQRNVEVWQLGLTGG